MEIAMLAEEDRTGSMTAGRAARLEAARPNRRLIVVGPTVYLSAQSAVDKQGRPLPVVLVGEATYLRTLLRISGAPDASCSYIDGSGACCGRSCEGQIFEIDGLPYCFRHAGVAEARAARRGTVFEISLPPDVDDRGFNLLSTLLRETGPRVMALLHNRFQGRSVNISADEHPRRIREGSALAWEQGWWATANAPLARVALRVSAGSLPQVAVMVDHVRRFTTVPDWTAARLPAARRALWHQMVMAVRQAVDEM
jgi:hypothetical protein